MMQDKKKKKMVQQQKRLLWNRADINGWLLTAGRVNTWSLARHSLPYSVQHTLRRPTLSAWKIWFEWECNVPLAPSFFFSSPALFVHFSLFEMRFSLSSSAIVCQVFLNVNVHRQLFLYMEHICDWLNSHFWAGRGSCWASRATLYLAYSGRDECQWS